MSAGLVTGAALLGALAGWAAVPLARRFATARPGDPPAEEPAPVRSGQAAPSRAVGHPCSPRRPVARRAARASTDGGPDATPGGSGRRGRLAVAAVGAVVFGGLALARGTDPALPAYLLIAAVGLALALVDLACLRLPDPLVALAAGCGGLGLAAAALAGGAAGRLLPALAGAALSFAGYVLLALLPRARLGFGDVKLGAALGLPLGWLGWPTLALGLLLPHLLNGVLALALLAARRVRRDTALPFGPAILAGAWLAILLAGD